jgi:phosphopantothenoylcysteine decarboxylase/phosphopantothenate--cysteine ligase
MVTAPADPAAPDPLPVVAALSGVRVVLGVSGGIAAYKAVEVCRRLVDLGAHVIPVLTAGALRFVGEATFSALASEQAHSSVFHDSDPIPHTRIGQRADLVIVAPATARVIGSYAAGISSDLLIATLLATRAAVILCPAMHAEMWEHAAVQENLEVLRRRGVHIVEPGIGRLAGGDVGVGRLAEPSDIVSAAIRILTDLRPPDLAGRRVLVTAGGTREPIDPVRFIANRSSGKQGYAIAEAAKARGATVTLVTTVQLPAPAGATVVAVETAAEMAEAVLSRAPDQDVIVMAAAVADFRPSVPAATKLPKTSGVPELVLEPTQDVLAELGKRRRNGQVLVGFAAETGSVAERAAQKLHLKKVDLVVGNDVGADGVGFAHDTNAVSIVSPEGSTEIPLTSKRAVADAVLDAAVARLAPSSTVIKEKEGP